MTTPSKKCLIVIPMDIIEKLDYVMADYQYTRTALIRHFIQEGIERYENLNNCKLVRVDDELHALSRDAVFPKRPTAASRAGNYTNGYGQTLQVEESQNGFGVPIQEGVSSNSMERQEVEACTARA